MKKQVLFFVGLAFVALLWSCDLFSGKSEQLENAKKENVVTVDTVNNVIQDSLMSGLKVQVDDLNERINEGKAAIDSLGKRIKEMQNPGILWKVLILFSFLSTLIMIIVKIKEKRPDILFNEQINKSHTINELTKKVSDLEERARGGSAKIKQGVSKPSYNEELESLERRIKKIEEKLSKEKTNFFEQTGVVPEPQPSYCKYLYAKVNTGDYITECFESQVDGCIYKLTLSDNNHATFELISLNSIKSRNNWECAIEVQYNGMTLDDAKDFKLSTHGRIEKRDGYWKVVEKMKIELLK